MLYPISIGMLYFFVQRYFFFLLLICCLTYWLFRSVLFNFNILVNFLVFFLLLTSRFITLWLEKILGMTSVFLNLLRLGLWPNVWPILENVLRALENNVCSAAVGWHVLYMSVMSTWPKVQHFLINLLPGWSHYRWKWDYWSPWLLWYCCLFIPSGLLLFALYIWIQCWLHIYIYDCSSSVTLS